MKPQRHSAILEVVRLQRVPSQEVLRELLGQRGIDVAQATLSRDIRELGLVKVPDEEGGSVYTVPAYVTDPTPTLTRLLPALYVGRRIRERRPRPPHACPHCGYDLRATPDRCPECGGVAVSR